MEDGYEPLRRDPSQQRLQALGPPPDYENSSPEIRPNDLEKNDKPPTYRVAAALPTYEEAELAKEGKLVGEYGRLHPTTPPVTSTTTTAATPRFSFFALPSTSGSEDCEAASDERFSSSDSSLLGNDFVFFTAFLTAFLFNWIGFLLLICFCHTIAARYGALSGFGLSLTKWTLIVKSSTDFVSAEHSWLWWLIMAFGIMICMRAFCQYLYVKKSWRHMSPAARERLFFIY